MNPRTNGEKTTKNWPSDHPPPPAVTSVGDTETTRLQPPARRNEMTLPTLNGALPRCCDCGEVVAPDGRCHWSPDAVRDQVSEQIAALTGT